MSEWGKKEKKKVSRRSFLVGTGAGAAGLAIGGVIGRTTLPPAKEGLPKAKGYLVVDSKNCAGCQSCMIACSVAHEGVANLSLSRIQVLENIMGRWPDDIQIAQCRQCVYPACVAACPNGALHIDTKNGNTRIIDEAKCTGCKACIEACPQIPHRIIWNPAKNIAIKCDLCANAPYWPHKGGIGGKQACVEVCPAKVIKFVEEVPVQTETVGYDVVLRTPTPKPGEQGS
ncbi:MAG TPA: 4Fe-4S dicluster domain-containing protein [Anaerolineae bacterium]|nr:4Fe-4S dicluster domain-containing protein [Anaerolineae bacterium]HOQ98871.1 4Fe-4S dicluster domain-containing protein [Anaerolineae bacterium]HPL28738.1 4Fe-4S dicluster domain-containing protein [Anaerolineae bacterium]